MAAKIRQKNRYARFLVHFFGKLYAIRSINRVGLIRLADLKAKQSGDGFDHIVNGVFIGEAHRDLLGDIGLRQLHFDAVDVFHRLDDSIEADAQ